MTKVDFHSEFEHLHDDSPDFSNAAHVLRGRYKVIAVLDEGKEDVVQKRFHSHEHAVACLEKFTAKGVRAALFRWEKGEAGQQTRGWIREM
jgi:hypothetical protein